MESCLSKDISSYFIVFDTNILLNFYNLKEIQIEDLKLLFEMLKDIIWCPHQVYFEYYEKKENGINGRERKINEIINSIKSMKGFCSDVSKKIHNQLKGYHRINIGISKEMQNEFDKYIDQIDCKMSFFKDKINQNINRLGKYKHELNDVLLQYYKKYIFFNLGREYSETVLENIKNEGMEKYKKHQAPGYGDSAKSNDNIYGDYIIWRQLIDIAKEKKKNIIFITNDNKRDWKDSDGRIRRDYAKEFAQLTTMNIEAYTMDEFIEEFTEYNNLESLLFYLNYYITGNISNNSPFIKQYNNCDLLEIITDEKKSEFKYFDGTDDIAYKELIKVRTFVEFNFSNLICGGVKQFCYTYALDVFEYNEKANKLLCRVMYKANSDLNVIVDNGDVWFTVNKDNYILEANGEIRKNGYIGHIIYCIYKSAENKNYKLVSKGSINNILQEVEEMQYRI